MNTTSSNTTSSNTGAYTKRETKAITMARDWNEFKAHWGTADFGLTEIGDFAKDYDLKYYRHIPGMMKHKGKLIPTSGRKFKFLTEPIHYTFFLDLLNKVSPACSGFKQKEEEEEEETRGVKINELCCFSADKLVQELRDRGYEVKATMLVEL